MTLRALSPSGENPTSTRLTSLIFTRSTRSTGHGMRWWMPGSTVSRCRTPKRRKSPSSFACTTYTPEARYRAARASSTPPTIRSRLRKTSRFSSANSPSTRYFLRYSKSSESSESTRMLFSSKILS